MSKTVEDIFNLLENNCVDNLHSYAPESMWKNNPEKALLLSIRRSNTFDEKYYLLKNPDVKDKGLDPVDHFIKFGFNEKRCYRIKGIDNQKISRINLYPTIINKYNINNIIITDSLKDKKFLFSIIMSVYNVEQYIREAVNSILWQDIGFIDNVQIIFVDDGSKDNSFNICMKYYNLYKDNIIIIKKANAGLSSARNVGLNFATGRYINFFDPDDILTENTLSHVYNFFEKNYLNIDMVSIPLYYFGRTNGIHDKYKYIGDKDRIIDLTKEPYNFILSAASSFYKKNIIEYKRYDQRMTSGEDAKINLDIIYKNMNIGYVCNNGVKYYYRQRDDFSSRIDAAQSRNNISFLFDPKYEFEKIHDKKHIMSKVTKELIVYELRSRIPLMNKKLLGEKNFYKIERIYKNLIKYLDIDFIFESKWLDNIEKKVLFAKFKNYSFEDLINGGFYNLSNSLINVRNAYFSDNFFFIEVTYNNFLYDILDIIIIDKENNIIESIKKIDIKSPYDFKFGDYTIDITHLRIFKIEFNENNYRFAIKNNNTIFPIHRFSINHKCIFTLGKKYIGPIRNGYLFSMYDGCIDVTNNTSILNTVNDRIERIFNKKISYRNYSFLKKKYILISDRPENPNDNGLAVFYYIMEHFGKDIKDITYYILNKNCTLYNQLKFKDNIVDFRSEEHLIKFLNAKVIISSHNSIDFYYPFNRSDYKMYADLLDYKFIWLQHGVIKDDITRESNKYKTLDDIVVTSTQREFNELSRPEYMYFNNEVICTGLPRFDNLINKKTITKKQRIILISPTWRANLVGKILTNGSNEPKSNFNKSLFYTNYSKLLMSNYLFNILKDNNFYIEFILHPGFTVYEEFFEKFSNERIKILKMKSFSYAEAFLRSSILITDFSSIAFDFAYLKRPIIYFQFDRHDFFSNHYRKGYFDYYNDGFGPVLKSVNEVITYVNNCIKRNCVIEGKYLSNINNEFPFIDNKNCKRLFAKINHILYS